MPPESTLPGITKTHWISRVTDRDAATVRLNGTPVDYTMVEWVVWPDGSASIKLDGWEIPTRIRATVHTAQGAISCNQLV